MAPEPDVEDVGREPDPRFTLANERTFLAWNRTALALIGGGLAAGQLLDFSSRAARLVVALPPIVLGLALALTSHRRWQANQRALRLGEPLPGAGPPWVLAVGIGIVGLVVLVAVVIDAVSLDEGAASERTVLARQRLAFSYLGLGAIFLGVAAHRELRWLLGVSVALVVAAGYVARERRAPGVLAALTAAAAACAIAGVLE